MLSPELGFAIFDRLLAAVGLIRESHKEKSERTDQSLYALYAALKETQSYVYLLRIGKERDREREIVIAKFWNDASVPLRKVDRDLAERCLIKGSYWLEPDTWSEIKINRAGIALNQIIKSTRQLLLGASDKGVKQRKGKR